MESSRPAGPDDVARIVELAQLLLEELRTMKGGALWARREARQGDPVTEYRDLVGREDARVVVGSVHDSIVGFGVLQLEPLSDGGLLGVITELFVEPEARAVGIGEVMIDDLVRFCVSNGCVGVDALALPGHREAKNFFEGSGFTARALVMHHSL